MNAPDISALAQGCGFDLACQTRQAASSALDGIASNVAHAAADLLVTSTTWWVRTASVNPLDPAVGTAQDATRSVVVLVLVASVLVQAIRLIISRRAEPLLMVASGLVRYAVVTALGLTVLRAALRAGDQLAVALLDSAGGNLAELLRFTLVGAHASFTLLVLSSAATVLAFVQWVLMALRQAGLLVLAAMVPLAASGSLTRATRGWLDRLLVWLVALVVYKPAAALIYYIGFTYLSSPATSRSVSYGSVGTMVTGLAVLLLAVIALPALLKFFTWSGTQLGGGGSGGGSGFLGAVGALGTVQGGGRAAVERAAALDATGPGSRTVAGSYIAPAGAAPTAASGPAAGAVAAAGVARQATRSAASGMTDPPETQS